MIACTSGSSGSAKLRLRLYIASLDLFQHPGSAAQALELYSGRIPAYADSQYGFSL